MTATPYRMLDGYIYRIDKTGKHDKALDDNQPSIRTLLPCP